MSARLHLIDPETATGAQAEVFATAKAGLGKVPNMVRAMANSPAAAKVFLTAFSTLAGGLLNGKQREAIALTVAQKNDCDYCVAAHTAIGKMHGLSDAQTVAARRGTTDATGDPAVNGVVTLARRLLITEGHLTDADLAAARQAGLNDGHIAEVVAHVAVSVYTNYFNHVAQPPVDFPAVQTV